LLRGGMPGELSTITPPDQAGRAIGINRIGAPDMERAKATAKPASSRSKAVA